MRVFGLEREIYQAWRLGWSELSQKEVDRLRALRIWQETRDVGLVCETFGISRATLYRWAKRFDPGDLSSLRDRSRRPRRLRKPLWSTELIMAARDLRTQYPRWGKDKLVVLLGQKGWKTSASTVGRIIAYLRRKGQLVEPPTRAISTRRRSIKRPYAIRKPKGYSVSEPGDLVQVDTLDIRPLPGIILKQFTARDTVSRWDVIEARSQATARTARQFLDTLDQRMPFAIRALQVDGGSEFFRDFETECQRRSLRLFVLPPRSPKLNGSVERAQRTHTEEFYQVYDCPWTVAELNTELKNWEYTYNCLRPHQALKYKTPLQFLKDNGIVVNYPSPQSHM
jgi:transposase InsO family protein